MKYIHGFHDEGGESLHGDRPGWTVITESVGTDVLRRGRDYSHIANRGIGVLVRLNHGYGSEGTIPLPDWYDEFAAACANFAATSRGVWGWIIGNEPNHPDERPNGVMITENEYSRCFTLTRNAIKRVGSSQRVGPAAIAPYRADPNPWDEYLSNVLYMIQDGGGCDFLTAHAYTRGMDPANVRSLAEMEGILASTHYGFYTFLDAFAQVPDSMRGLPAFITEMNVYEDWEDQNTGVITAMYDTINAYNEGPNNLPIIKGATLFRWLGPPEVENRFDWEIRNKPGLLEDFRQVVARGYQSPLAGTFNVPLEPGSLKTFLPDLGVDRPKLNGMAPKVDIDPRIAGEIRIVEGQPDANGSIWDVVRVQWFDKAQAGGRRNIYVEFEGVDGEPIIGVPFFVTWPTGSSPQTLSNGKRGFDAANQPVTPGRGAFSVVVPNGDSIHGVGMGAMTDTGFNPGIHAVYVVTYRRRYVGKSPAQPMPMPPKVEPVPARLLHPVVDPALRGVSQHWGERPDFYKQYNVDGVPLKGHEGIDFLTPIGSQIQAVADGRIVEVGDQGAKGYGKYIKLDTRQYEAVYAHLEEQWVKVGDRVEAGDVIGATGATGNVDGPHLHFGLREKPYDRRDGWGGYVNPLPYLTGSSSTTTPEPAPSQSKSALVQIVKEAAQEAGLGWRLLVSLIHGESSFNPLSRNPSSGAAGLGNLMPGTWEEWAPRVGATDIFDARDNARVTARYLKWCIELAKGDERRALWAYNWSPKQISLGNFKPPQETIHFASKVLHGKEVAELVG